MADLGNRTPIRFDTSHRAKFSDLDPNGHVNTERYLSYFLDHRFNGIRERLGWGLKELAALPVFFVVRKVELEFRKPVFGDEPFRITSAVKNVGTASCEVQCELSKGEGIVASACRLDLVCLDRKTMAPTPWPEEVIGRFFE